MGIVAHTDRANRPRRLERRKVLYAQTGLGGSVHAYRVDADGTLTEIGKVTRLPQGMEGIAAT